MVNATLGVAPPRRVLLSCVYQYVVTDAWCFSCCAVRSVCCTDALSCLSGDIDQCAVLMRCGFLRHAVFFCSVLRGPIGCTEGLAFSCTLGCPVFFPPAGLPGAPLFIVLPRAHPSLSLSSCCSVLLLQIGSFGIFTYLLHGFDSFSLGRHSSLSFLTSLAYSLGW